MPTTVTSERAQLLSTKLFPPRRDATLVPRPRLVARMNEGARGALTVVSAPAGFGKTTLLTEWLAQWTGPTGWISLDGSDSDPTLFWAYVVVAFQEMHASVGRGALSLLFSPRPPPIRVVLSSLINDIFSVGGDFVLVLDDVHLVDQPLIHDGLSYLVDHLPVGVGLVLVSRSEPAFPVARLRGQGRLTELTVDDLRFTTDEAAAFLGQVMGLEVDGAAVAALEARTEGWIAGLQLAALGMRGRHDIDGFVASFSGGHRHIADFLTEEVLHGQPASTRAFLLRTSVLQRLCGPLCDAVTGSDGGAGILQELARGNLFVVHLDDQRAWYRYHHLFADVLRERLWLEEPERVPELHRRASVWYEGEGLHAEAVHHALRAHDVERAADLVERSWRTLDRRFQSATWRGWVDALPPETLLRRPVLALGYGWALLDAGRIDEGEAYLDRAEGWLDDPDEEGRRIVADEREFRSLPATLAAARAYVAQARGDLEGTERHARRALELLPEDDPFYRGIPAVTVGLAQWFRGELEDAHASFDDAVKSFSLAGNDLFTLSALYAVGEIRRQQGLLAEAQAVFQQALLLDDPLGDRRGRVERGLAEIALERGELEDAAVRLASCEKSGPDALDHRWHLAMADLHEARGDAEAAWACLAVAEARHAPGLLPDLRPVSARRTRLLLSQGRLDEARAWAEARALSVEDEPGFLDEYEFLTLARVHLALMEGGAPEPRAMASFLERLSGAAAEGGRLGSRIEALTLQARFHASRHNGAAAQEFLVEALELAGAEGFYWIFLQDGAALKEPLRAALSGGAHRPLVRRLHAALTGPDPTPTPRTQELVETPTPRELEVLRLVAAGLRNREIAKDLFISEATVKRHLANVYGKLGVTHRTRAVARADALGLL